MRPILWLDFETRSRCDLLVHGGYNYARDPSTGPLCMCYVFGDDEEILEWDALTGDDFPAAVSAHIAAGGQIRAHNAQFERLIFWYVICPDYGVPEPKLEQFYCTATEARANAMPGKLEDVARAAGAGMRKDYRGAELIRKLSIPRADGTFCEDDDLLDEMIEYCAQDVRTMRAASKLMRSLTDEELADYHVNERINDNGVRLDMPLAQAAVQYALAETKEVQAEVVDLTDGVITSVRSPKLRQWVMDRVGGQAIQLMTIYKKGVKTFSIDKNVRANLLLLADEMPDEVPDVVADVIQCADDLWASSVAKFSRAAALADPDDHRVRGAFIFSGASATGRAASYGLQVHNYPRKCAKNPQELRDDMVAGAPLVPTYGPRVTDVLKAMLRPSLIPSDGNVFVVADWSGVEARGLPWLANSPRAEEVLDVFRRGEDIYITAANGIYNINGRAEGEELIGITAEQRQIGKVSCIAEGSMVLTDCGLVPIEHVALDMKVWDGVEFVQHSGAILQGYMEVISYDGLTATPDHRVWVEGSPGAIRFDVAAASGARLVKSGAGGYALRVGDHNLARTEVRPRVGAPVRADGMQSVPLAAVDPLRQPETRENHGVPTMQSAITGAKVAHKTIVRRAVAMYESAQQKLEKLWRAGYSILFHLSARGGSMAVGKYAATVTGVRTGPQGQQRALRAGELTVGYPAAKREQHSRSDTRAGIPRVPCRAPGGTLRRQHTEKSAVDRADIPANCGPLGRPVGQAKRRVWDLLDAGPRHRFTVSGKLVHNCLSLGYGGGINAFASMAKNYGVLLPEHQVAQIVKSWRRTNGWATTFWQQLESAVVYALRHPNQELRAGRVLYLYDGQHLWCMLPSGRILCYPFAKRDGDEIGYMKAAWKPAADATEWPRAKLYGGLAAENITQAVCNDLLRAALRELQPQLARYNTKIVLHVHDEIVVECPAHHADAVRALVEQVMCAPPQWATGFPLDVGIKVMPRYGK